MENSEHGPRELLSMREVAARLGVSRMTLYRLIEAGRLDARKLGGKTVITTESVRAFIASLPKVGSQPAEPAAQAAPAAPAAPTAPAPAAPAAPPPQREPGQVSAPPPTAPTPPQPPEGARRHWKPEDDPEYMRRLAEYKRSLAEYKRSLGQPE